MNHRDLLSAVGSAATGSVGCLSSLGRGNYEEIRLGLVTVSNRSERDQTVDLVLRRDGETVSWTRHDVRARDGDVIPGDRIGCLLDEPAGAFDLPLVPNGHRTRNVFLVVTEAETIEPFGPAGPADEEHCRNAPVLDGAGSP